MRFFISHDAVKEHLIQKRDEAELAQQRVHAMIVEFEARANGDEQNKRWIESEVRQMGGIGYLRQKRSEHGGTRAAYDDAIRALDEVLPDSEVPKFMQAGLVEPSTCVLTGADGENDEDCTTHDHEVLDSPGQPPEQVEVSVTPLAPEFWERLARDMKDQHGIDISFTETDDDDDLINAVL